MSLRKIPEGGRQIADNGGLVSRDITRISVLQHHGVASPELLSRPHDSDRGTATAGMFGTCVERGLKAVGVESGHVIDDNGVEPRCRAASR